MKNEKSRRKNRYKINMAARQAGVSPQTVRYYEKEGLIEAQRDEFGTTRYYSARHFKQLANVRRYYKLGFSDGDVRFLMGCENPGEMEAFFRQKAEQEERAVLLARRRAWAMRKQAEDLARMRSWTGLCDLSVSPTLAVLITRVGDEMLEGPELEEILERWIGCMHLTRLASLIRREDFLERPQEERRSSGYCCYEEDLGAMGTGPGDARILHMPARLCVHALGRLAGENLAPVAVLPEAMEFIRQNGLAVCADVYGRCLAVLGEAQIRTAGHPRETWYEYWIPVKKTEEGLESHTI